MSVFFQGLHISVYTTFNLASWVGKKDVGEGKGIGYGKANVEEMPPPPTQIMAALTVCTWWTVLANKIP